MRLLGTPATRRNSKRLPASWAMLQGNNKALQLGVGLLQNFPLCSVAAACRLFYSVNFEPMRRQQPRQAFDQQRDGKVAASPLGLRLVSKMVALHLLNFGKGGSFVAVTRLILTGLRRGVGRQHGGGSSSRQQHVGGAARMDLFIRWQGFLATKLWQQVEVEEALVGCLGGHRQSLC